MPANFFFPSSLSIVKLRTGNKTLPNKFDCYLAYIYVYMVFHSKELEAQEKEDKKR